jgi:hypothetical protein
MDPVIYSASPIQAFLGNIGGIAFMLFLAVAGAGWAIFNRKESKAARIAAGCASVVLLVAGAATGFFSITSALSGDQTVTVTLDRKREVTRSCENGPCTSFVLETHAGQIYYDFTVPRDAYDRAEEDACYDITYYPPSSMRDSTATYQAASNITRIENVSCP